MEDKENKLFVGGLPWGIEKDVMEEHFSKYGQVVSCVIAKDRFSGNPRGFGFVTFSLPAAAQEALNHTHHINGKLVEVKRAEPALNTCTSIVGGSQALTNKKIFVGGLPLNLTDDEFKEYFEKFGSITDIVIVHDSVTNKSRGFGFITFESEGSIEEVTKTRFYQLKGKRVEVKMFVPKEMMNRMGGGSNFNFYYNNNRNDLFSPYPRYRPPPCYYESGFFMYPFGDAFLGSCGVYGGGNYMPVPTAPGSPWYYYPQMLGSLSRMKIM